MLSDRRLNRNWISSNKTSLVFVWCAPRRTVGRVGCEPNLCALLTNADTFNVTEPKHDTLALHRQTRWWCRSVARARFATRWTGQRCCCCCCRSVCAFSMLFSLVSRSFCCGAVPERTAKHSVEIHEALLFIVNIPHGVEYIYIYKCDAAANTHSASYDRTALTSQHCAIATNSDWICSICKRLFLPAARRYTNSACVLFVAWISTVNFSAGTNSRFNEKQIRPINDCVLRVFNARAAPQPHRRLNDAQRSVSYRLWYHICCGRSHDACHSDSKWAPRVSLLNLRCWHFGAMVWPGLACIAHIAIPHIKFSFTRLELENGFTANESATTRWGARSANKLIFFPSVLHLQFARTIINQ